MEWNGTGFLTAPSPAEAMLLNGLTACEHPTQANWTLLYQMTIMARGATLVANTP